MQLSDFIATLYCFMDHQELAHFAIGALGAVVEHGEVGDGAMMSGSSNADVGTKVTDVVILE